MWKVIAKSYIPLVRLEYRRVVVEELVKPAAQREYVSGTILSDATTST